VSGQLQAPAALQFAVKEIGNCVAEISIQLNLSKAERELGGNLLNVNKSYSPGQRNGRYSVIYFIFEF
jgi:hypothetical protein